MPTRPSPSPTTVSAAKARMRPPFTTLVTRLMAIIFSRRPSPRSSCCCLPCCLPIGFAMFVPVCLALLLRALELQAALASGVGQRLHATVILESGTVECNRIDTQLLRFFRNALSNHGRRSLVAAVLQVLPDVAF